ncbi:hypothetical protein [Leifsonia aquatica]|uniref:hypothetical protein n=1 Tax=Leifsonia aquatica TaxID=144185 RepID=UPI00046A8C51|nr:hypothetical protein [Leifsonia aquatica]
MDREQIKADMVTALTLRMRNGGRHLHHRSCIHNLPPEEQIALRGRTVEQWLALHGSMPTQITPAEWEIESPFGTSDHTNRSSVDPGRDE